MSFSFLEENPQKIVPLALRRRAGRDITCMYWERSLPVRLMRGANWRQPRGCGMNVLSGSERHGGPGRRRLSSLCYRAARLGPAEKAQSTLMVEPMRVDPFISSMAPCASFCFSYSTKA